MSRGALVLAAVFCSPLYFALRQKWLAAIVNSVFYALALLCLISLIGAVFGVFFWLIGLSHALWDFGMLLRDDQARRQADLIAERTGGLQ